MTGHCYNSAALIVGITIQGLAIARALAQRGVTVYAVERRTNSPASKSRYFEMFSREGVNPEALPDTLSELRKKLPEDRIVLFPCSDKTVRALAANWAVLSDRFSLSWSGCTEVTASMTYKAMTYRHAAETGVDFPRTIMIDSPDDCMNADDMRFPLIVKPDQPPGSFKTRKIWTADQLRSLAIKHRNSLPFVVQEWVAGGDDKLLFCTLFLDKGRVLAGVTGRKRRSYQGIGRGTVMELCEDPEVRERSLQFLSGLPLCGPVAVEFKRDPEGRLWLIEPNVGRTEYCVDLTIQGGLNLPYLEYCYTLGLPYEDYAGAPLDPDVIWYDTELEPHCFLLEMARQRTFRPWGKRPVFPFFGHDDHRPLLYAFFRLLLKTFQKGLMGGGRRILGLIDFWRM